MQDDKSSLRILYLANIRLPTEKAHGIQIMNTCSALAKAGAQVELVVPTRHNALREDPFEYYDIPKNFSIKKIFCLDTTARLGMVGSALQTFTFFLASFLFILREKKNHDVIYSRHESLLFLPSLCLNKATFWESHVGVYNWRVRLLLPRLAGIITITEAGKKLYESHSMPPEKILVAHDGVDLEKFTVRESKEECRKKLNLPLDKKIVGYIGVGSVGIYDWKGVDIFLQAARYFRDGTLCLLVGGGKEEAVHALKKQYAGDGILFVDRQNHSTLPFYMKACDALVLPNKKGDTISERYTSPMKLFEYMTSGTPIVASDLPSIREVLDEETAMFFEANSPEDLRRAIQSVLGDREAAKERARKALAIVRQYSWSARASAIRKHLFSCAFLYFLLIV